MRPHRVLALLAAAIACAWLGVSTWRAVEQRRLLERTTLASPPGIERLESVQLGGAEQWILVRGADIHAPILLWLHGGPGDPRMPRARVSDVELVKHFLVVHWDQRGAGKSLTAGLRPGALTIERLVADACELARLMQDRFGGRRIVLAGSSWGTDLGAYAVARCPEHFAAWVSISTDVNPRRAEQISYQFVLEQARAAGDAAAIRALEGIGPPVCSHYSSVLISLAVRGA